jgi:hypothetical protein
MPSQLVVLGRILVVVTDVVRDGDALLCINGVLVVVHLCMNHFF